MGAGFFFGNLPFVQVRGIKGWRSGGAGGVGVKPESFRPLGRLFMQRCGLFLSVELECGCVQFGVLECGCVQFGTGVLTGPDG